MTDKLLKGWKEIAEYLRVSKRTVQRRREEFFQNKVIFYQHSGRPPQKYVCAFTTILREYVGDINGESQPDSQLIDGEIYFIQGRPKHPIKIGFSTNCPHRLSTLQNSSPVSLTIIAKMPGNVQIEKELHERFKQYRTHGEWFHPAPELISFIKSIKKTEKK